MTGIYFLFPTLFIIFISFLVVRAAAIALMLTGLDKKRLYFKLSQHLPVLVSLRVKLKKLSIIL
jgi:hypothetical protein